MTQETYTKTAKKEGKSMETVLHKANTRGHVNHGWLDTYHSFSFANYYNPERMNFGALRVLNDDTVAPGKGFGTHPHDNMEIISIPLSGELVHKDSMDNETVIKNGDIQVMSAGSGIFHSEYNKNHDKEVKFLQIWVLTNKKNVEPRYDQISLKNIKKENELYQFLSPKVDDKGVWIYQNAWFHMGNLNKDWKGDYQLKDKSNGVYVFVLEGEISINGQSLSRRDGIGVWNAESVNIVANSNAHILLMEVPMQI